MIPHHPSKQRSCEVLVDNISMKFSYAPSGTKVSTHTFHSQFESDENSWGTMVKSQTPKISPTKETFLLTS